MTKLPHAIWLRAFDSASRLGSFSQAAEELNLTQAAVSHRVRQLEAVLGCKLFHRQPRKLLLTEMGKAYLPSIRMTFDNLSVTTTGLFGPIGNTVRSLSVRAPITFATLWLAPRLDLFCELYPGIDVRLKTSVWAGGAEEEHETDIEIRNGYGRWAGFHAELLITDVAVPVCSPATLERNGPVTRVEDFAECHLVHILSLEDLWQRFIRSSGAETRMKMEGVIVDSTVAALELASAGKRYAIAPSKFAQSYLDTGRLVHAHPYTIGLKTGNYLLTHADQEPSKPEAILFRNWILNECRR